MASQLEHWNRKSKELITEVAAAAAARKHNRSGGAVAAAAPATAVPAAVGAGVPPSPASTPNTSGTAVAPIVLADDTTSV